MTTHENILRPDDPEVILEEKLEHLRIMLSATMRQLRDQQELTQSELAGRLGLKQSAISKLESTDIKSSLESIQRYLHALGAELVVAIKHGDELHQVSDDVDFVVIDLPRRLADRLTAGGENLRSATHRILQPARSRLPDPYLRSLAKHRGPLIPPPEYNTPSSNPVAATDADDPGVAS